MTTRQKARTADSQPDLLAAIGALLEDIAPLDCAPTLVGGMALVTLGSPRVTKDFDFLVVDEAREEKGLVQAFYRRGFELVSATDHLGNVLQTIDSQRVAFARLRMDRPRGVYFYNAELGLKVDLLFDFPLDAREVRSRSTPKTIGSYAFHIAAREDLVRMKEIAASARGLSSDLQDLEFLEKI